MPKCANIHSFLNKIITSVLVLSPWCIQYVMQHYLYYTVFIGNTSNITYYSSKVYSELK